MLEWNTSNPFTGKNINCIRIAISEHITIRDCEIKRANTNGIKIKGMKNSVIENNHIHHCGGVYYSDGVGGGGIRFSGEYSASVNNTIQNNYIHNIREHGIKIYVTKPQDYNKILFNTIAYCNMGDWDKDDNPYGAGIDQQGSYTLIEGNTIFINDLMEQGIVSHNTVEHVIIKNNHLLEGFKYTVMHIGRSLCYIPQCRDLEFTVFLRFFNNTAQS